MPLSCRYFNMLYRIIGPNNSYDQYPFLKTKFYKMKAPTIQQDILMKKRDEIMAGIEESAIKIKRLQWMGAFKNAIAFGNLNKYLQLAELQRADPDLSSIDMFLAYKKQFKHSVLHAMCFNDRQAMLTYFIENKLVNINELDENRQTPLFVAVMKSILTGNTHMVELMLEAGADILHKDLSEKTVYDYCLMQDPQQILPTSIIISRIYNQKHSQKLREVFYMIMNTEGRMRPPLCYLYDRDLYGVLDLL